MATYSIGTQRGTWIVCTGGFAEHGYVDLVRQPRSTALPERDVMDVLDLGLRQQHAQTAFEPGQVTVVRGEAVRLVPLSWWWRRRVHRRLGVRSGRMLRVVPA
jgi:hypothetical protein